jgi:hypothetical protein
MASIGTWDWKTEEHQDCGKKDDALDCGAIPPLSFAWEKKAAE